MAAMSSNSSLRLRQTPSHMMAAVSAAVEAEMASNPADVPVSILRKAADWSAPSVAGIHIIGHEARMAGWRHDRLPGLRDIVGEFHPVFDRIMLLARHHEGAVTGDREAALRMPANRASLWQAAIYRWPSWFGIDCDLSQVYRDSGGRLANDPAYTGQIYDADHCPDELLRQVLDVTLIDWISLLETLRATWPEMFDAVWHRDAVAVDRLSRQNRRLPDMPFLRVRKDPDERLRTVVVIFWEAERLFELMHAIGGPSRVTMTKLLTALGSTSMLGGAVGAGDATGRYIGSMWCHRGGLALLFGDGLGMGHDPRHPHWSFGPGGDADIADEIDGCVTEAALDLARFNTLTAPPFAIDSRLRDVLGEEPAHFFAGQDVRLLAVRFLLEVRARRGGSKGRKPNQSSPLFEIATDSAIGRLAVLSIARVCSDTARSIIREAVDAKAAIGKPLSMVGRLADVVANPRAWLTIHGRMPPVHSIAKRSENLGSDIFASMVNKGRQDASQFITNDSGTPGHTICFTPGIWFDPYCEADALRTAWESVGSDHETAFPGCFDRSTPADELAFCVRVAARQQVAATDMLRDPHCRQPDCIRSPNRGRAGKNAVLPPAAPLTASQRLLLARIMAAAKGGPLIQPIPGR